MHRFCRRRVAVANKQVKGVGLVRPGADAVGGGVGARLGEGGDTAGKLPIVVHQMNAQSFPFFPQFPDAVRPAFAPQCPNMDVFSLNTGISVLDGLHDFGSGGAEVDEDGLVVGIVHHLFGQEEIAHVAFVWPRHAQGFVEQMKDCHGAGFAAFGEAGGVFQSIDGGAPHCDARFLDLFVKLFPLITLFVYQTDDPVVQPAGHFRPGVDPSESQIGIGTHFRSFTGFGHQALAQAYHNGVIFRQLQ